MKLHKMKKAKSYITLRQRITAAFMVAVLLLQICVPTVALAATAWGSQAEFNRQIQLQLESGLFSSVEVAAADEAYKAAFYVYQDVQEANNLLDFYRSYNCVTDSPVIKQIGDTFVQTRLIRSQIKALMGRFLIQESIAPLTVYEAEAERINELYKSGIAYGKKTCDNKIPMGSPLAENISITADMIWPEVRTINNKPVLIPVVYLSQATLAKKVDDHDINLFGDTEFASITLDKDILLNGYNNTIVGINGIINGGGKIESSGNLTLISSGTIANLGGVFGATENLKIVAEDFYNKTLVVPYKDKNGEGTKVGSVASITGGSIEVVAADGITFEGASAISTEGTLTLNAENNINILPVTTQNNSQSQQGDWKVNKSTTDLLMSRLAAEDTLSLIAGGVITITASELISTRGGIELLAKNGIHILDELEQTSIQKDDRKGKTKGTSSEFRTEAVRAILSAGKGVLLDSEHGDVVLRATQLTSTSGTEVYARNGKVHLLMTKELEEFHLQTVKKSTWTIKTRTEDIVHENNIQNAIVGGLKVQAMHGINVEYTGKEGASLKEQLEEYAKMPEMAWMADIYNSCWIERDLPNDATPIDDVVDSTVDISGSPNICDKQKVSWKEIQEIHEEIRKSKSTLSPAAMAIIAICVAVAMGPVGAGWLGSGSGAIGATTVGGVTTISTTGAILQAGALTLATQAGQSLAAGNNVRETLDAMDSDESLKALAISMATAGAMQYTDFEIFKIAEGASTPMALAQQAGQAVVNSTVSAGISVIINGGNAKDFENAFVQGLAMSAVSKLGEKMANKIGDASKAGNINDVVKYLAHAGAGCVIGVASAAASGSSDDNKYTCYSGAGGAVIGEFIADQYKENVGIKDLEEAEYETRKWLDENGLSTTMTDEQYNALTPTQQKELAALSPARFISASEFANLKAKGVDIAKLGAGLAALAAGGDVSIAAQTGENAAKNNAFHLVIIGAYYAYRAYQAYVFVEAVVQLGTKINAIVEGRAAYPTEAEFIVALEQAVTDFAIEKGLEKLLGGKRGTAALKMISDNMKSTGVGKNIVDELDKVVDALEGDKPYKATGSTPLTSDRADITKQAAAEKVVVDQDKYKYVFGHVDSSTHNYGRSKQLELDMQALGVPDNQYGHQLLNEHIEKTAKTSGNVVDDYVNEFGKFEVRESLLIGPSGKAGLFVATYHVLEDGTRKFSTVIIKRDKN